MKVYRSASSSYDIEELGYTTEPGDILIKNLEYKGNDSRDFCRVCGTVEDSNIKVNNKGYKEKPVTDTVCNVYKVILTDCYASGFILVAARSLEEANKLCLQEFKYIDNKDNPDNDDIMFGGYYQTNLRIIKDLIYHGEPTVIEEFHTLEDY